MRYGEEFIEGGIVVNVEEDNVNSYMKTDEKAHQEFRKSKETIRS
jgi:hypothetical protein